MEEIKEVLTKEQLRSKANRLPLRPGVYIMRRKNGDVIYVGKSKALKNRVSQYFGGSEQNVKTAKMVQNVANFEYMLTDTEMEALALENSLIKLYKPKYNILLKDGKSYPYIKVDLTKEYPKIEFTRKRTADKARYFGPYSGGSVVYNVIHTLQRAFGIACCKYTFPKDIGRVRPCIYHQIGQCSAPCSGTVSSEEYKALFHQLLPVLGGHLSAVKEQLQEKMMAASDNMQYEAAALYRDRLAAIEALKSRQKVLCSPDVSCDIFSLYTDEVCSAIGMYIIREGALMDSDSFVFANDVIVDAETVPGFLYEIYKNRSDIPHKVYLGMPFAESIGEDIGRMLSDLCGHKVMVQEPKKGALHALTLTVKDYAEHEAREYKLRHEKDSKMLFRLAELLALEVYPERIEAYDISNYGKENITGGMVVAINGAFKKSEYRTYNIKTTAGQDDYASMAEMLNRRLDHGSLPDLILLDGGKGHVGVVRQVLQEKGYSIPVFGMVKDDFHKTRAICDEEHLISIANEQSVFQFVYQLQEEVHRFTITRMRAKKTKSIKHSVLEQVSGVGPAKAKAILAHFGGLAGVKAADVEALAQVKGVTMKNAQDIKEFLNK
ncbi:MAG: excinuclease ABC subunit UvrC [Clostridiales bacterium]|nr:excinuclease ABC subunit UvrC [Clostridiales bacterium]